MAAQFAALGIQIISADQIARELTANDQPAFQPILQHFGEAVLTATGELNRRYLRELIFSNAKDRVWLEKLLHPLIRKQIQADICKTTSPYCLVEIPLLTNRSDYPYLDRVLLVLANPEQQIARLMARDNNSKAQASAILVSQADENTYRTVADDIIVNDGAIEALLKKIEALHTEYLRRGERLG